MPKTNDEKVRILNKACEVLPQDQIYFLKEIQEEFITKQHFKDKKILVNAHITTITLLVIANLIAGGAEVDVMATPPLCVHGPEMGDHDAMKPLSEAEIEFMDFNSIPETKKEDYYDLVFDCGAGTNNLIVPKIGVLELTKTNRSDYTSIKKPIVSVDLSIAKKIETLYGTGDGLYRALAPLLLNDISPEPGEPIQNNPYVFLGAYIDLLKKQNKKILLFGAGKVGIGIVSALTGKKFRKMIVVADIDVNKLLRIKKHRVSIWNLNDPRPLSLESKNIFAVITATGIPNLISNYIRNGIFQEQDFTNAYKINMGTPDEWGDKFSEKEILNDKKPINFSLQYPTLPMYLDGVFSCWLKIGEDLFLDKNNYKCGIINKVPDRIDKNVISKWTCLYDKDPNDLSSSDDSSACMQDFQMLKKQGFFNLTSSSGSNSEYDEDSEDKNQAEDNPHLLTETSCAKKTFDNRYLLDKTNPMARQTYRGTSRPSSH